MLKKVLEPVGNFAVFNSKILYCLFIFSVLPLGGCANTLSGPKYDSPIPAIDSRLFGKRPRDIIPANEIFAVNAKHQKEFLRYFNNTKYSHVDDHRRLANYVEQLLEDFEYSTKTQIANDTLTKKSGDCMSLATMTTALASLVNINVGYKMINNSPFYDLRGDVIIRGNHVRSILHERVISTSSGEFYNFRPSIYIDFFPSPGDTAGRRITNRQFVAMFYRNLAAKALWEKNYKRSFWLLMEAASIAPYDHDNVNMLAILHRRSGHLEKAEELYLYGLENTLSQVSLLRNYRVLLNSQNRLAEAQAISDRLAKIDDRNPFNWIYLAEDHFKKEQYKDAIYFYRKALAVAPHLHHAYQGLAKAYFKQGKVKRAQQALNEAIKRSDDEEVRAQYLSKLKALNIATR